MAPRTIPQRELRNNIGAVLREAEAGATFTITVRGRPVATLGTHAGRRVDVDRETLRGIAAAGVGQPMPASWQALAYLPLQISEGS